MVPSTWSPCTLVYRTCLCMPCSWVVDKVTKVARPMSAPKIQDLGSGRQQHQGSNSIGPTWRNDLMEMSELPTHLVRRFASTATRAPIFVAIICQRAAPCMGVLLHKRIAVSVEHDHAERPSHLGHGYKCPQAHHHNQAHAPLSPTC